MKKRPATSDRLAFEDDLHVHALLLDVAVHVALTLLLMPLVARRRSG